MPLWNNNKSIKEQVEDKVTVISEEASEHPDFKNMSIDELINFKLSLKLKINEIKEVMRAAHQVYIYKLNLWYAEEALKRAGIEGIVVEPAPAKITLKGG